jgi:hypothetical protein
LNRIYNLRGKYWKALVFNRQGLFYWVQTYASCITKAQMIWHKLSEAGMESTVNKAECQAKIGNYAKLKEVIAPLIKRDAEDPAIAKVLNLLRNEHEIT